MGKRSSLWQEKGSTGGILFVCFYSFNQLIFLESFFILYSEILQF